MSARRGDAGPDRPASGASGNNGNREDTRRRGKYQGERSFQIWTVKFDGSSRFYQAYADRPTAELVANRLREIGLPCEIRQAAT
jgi:hypothetical protein